MYQLENIIAVKKLSTFRK